MNKKYFLISAYFVLLFVLVFGAVGIAFALLYPFDYKSQITTYSQKYDLDPVLVASIINVESSYNKNKTSPVGAIGLMQIMPATAMEIATKKGVENFSVSSLYEVETNLDYGCYYLRYLINIYGDKTTNVLASYNAGLNKVRAWLMDEHYSPNGVTISSTPYEETNAFITRVQNSYKNYSHRF